MMTQAEIEQFDLVNACWHEAAHHVVAEHFGCRSGWAVCPTRTTDQYAKTWVGRCWFSPCSGEAERMISLAGPIAESLWKDPDPDPESMFDELMGDAAALSPSDRAGAGDFNFAHVEDCLELVTELWPLIEAEVNEHLREHHAESEALEAQA